MEQTKQYEYVDLGLPSGLKWAKCNVGATSETEYGYYFQWGDIEDKSKSDCSWRTYEHCNGTYNTLTKYCTNSSYGTVDSITTLESVDDAATQIMGSDWRMPTQSEFQELIDNTTKEWTQVNGVNGYKFTSNKEGFQNNSIFFPAAGDYDDGSVDYVGKYGGVWSSSLLTSSPGSAWYLGFSSSGCGMGYYRRYDGRSVRGVMD